MNLSALEKMVRDGDLSADSLRYLLDCKGECEWLDYKETLGLENDKALCDFGKDALAFKNVGGGFIVVGVKDKSWEAIGLPQRLPYDTKLLRDKVRRATGLDLEVDIVHHDQFVDGSSRQFAVIVVRASKKRKRRRTPTPVKHDFCASTTHGLRRGEIYARSGDSTVRVASTEQLEDLLDRLEEASDQQAAQANEPPSPFAIEVGLYRLLETGYGHFVGRQRLRQQLRDAVLGDPRLWIINVHGPGGVGKSALVNWVVHDLYRGEAFESIIQLTAKESVLTEAGIQRHSRCLYSLENLLDHILAVFQQPSGTDVAQKKTTAIEILSTWRTHLVLDNMETVADGRILDFVRSLPVDTRTKVLLTSRHKTGGWELPIPVTELSKAEVVEFLTLVAEELQISFPVDEPTVDKVAMVTGGLPLAIKWLLGQFKRTKDLHSVLGRVAERDSPVLEFSFRNMWGSLSADARAMLAALSIFDAPPSAHMVSIASGYSLETVSRALSELQEVTLVTAITNPKDGQVAYSALPITLSFARHQLHDMGEFEKQSRQRLMEYTQQLSLQDGEVSRFKNDFDRYGIAGDNERRAVILCSRAESEAFAGRVESAELFLKQARDLAPQSSYVHARRAVFELTRNHIGAALEAADEACRRCTKRTGAMCFTVKAQVLDAQRDRVGRAEALRKALEFAPDDVVLRHQYGVAVSRAGHTQQAIEEFSMIIDVEGRKTTPSLTMIMALTTRVINLRRLGQNAEAADDLRRASVLVAKHPHLAHAASRIGELADSPE
ncbi:MAG: NB-ARC domain-containing protein [Fimbriimonadales bacterium]